MASYDELIVQMLEGRTPELEEIPPGRLDWAGVSQVLALYDGTAGSERTVIIDAFGRIIEDATLPPPVVAEVVSLAASLDLAQLEPSVEKLHHRLRTERLPQAEAAMLEHAVGNFLAYRQLGGLLARRLVPSMANDRVEVTATA